MGAIGLPEPSAQSMAPDSPDPTDLATEPEVEADKAVLRQHMRRTIDAMTASEARQAGEVIASQLADWSGWTTAVAVALFASRPDEVDTRPLIRLAQRDGKQLYLPRMISGRTLEFARVSEMGSLKAGRLGVLEPDESCLARSIEQDWLILVPGLAFDRNGGRLGRGAGYYDRALGAPALVQGRPKLLGVGFACQIIEHVPTTSLDVQMDGVVTDVERFAVG